VVQLQSPIRYYYKSLEVNHSGSGEGKNTSEWM
jgi:hypothetical protein